MAAKKKVTKKAPTSRADTANASGAPRELTPTEQIEHLERGRHYLEERNADERCARGEAESQRDGLLALIGIAQRSNAYVRYDDRPQEAKGY